MLTLDDCICQCVLIYFPGCFLASFTTQGSISASWPGMVDDNADLTMLPPGCTIRYSRVEAYLWIPQARRRNTHLAKLSFTTIHWAGQFQHTSFIPYDDSLQLTLRLGALLWDVLRMDGSTAGKLPSEWGVREY